MPAKRPVGYPFDVVFATADGTIVDVSRYGDWTSIRRELARAQAEELAELHDASIGVYVQGRKDRALLQFVIQPLSAFGLEVAR